jgi:LuxR family maltose regulon positive regulatory protein
MAIRTLVMEDHSALARALRLLLEQDDELEVVGVAPEDRSAFGLVESLQPDVVVLDVDEAEENWPALLAGIQDAAPTAEVVALAYYVPTSLAVRQLLGLGVAGIVSMEDLSRELAAAVRQVVAGSSYFSAELTRWLGLKNGKKSHNGNGSVAFAV